MHPYTVSASFCECLDSLDCLAESAEDAIEQFHETLDTMGLPPWPDFMIKVRDMAGSETEVLHMASGEEIPIWKKGRLIHLSFYPISF